MNNQATNQAATFNYNFTFRSIAATDKKYAETKADFDKHGIKYDVDSETNAIKRVSQLEALPLLQWGAFSAAFQQQEIEKVIYNAAKKLYIDNCLPIGSLTAADIEEAMTAKEGSSAAFSKEDLATFAGFLEQVLTASGITGATASIILELVNGRFTSQVCNKYQRHAEKYPKMLGICLDSLQHVPEENADILPIFNAVIDGLTTNYERWVKIAESLDAELDI